jgi:hypothetical protein
VKDIKFVKLWEQDPTTAVISPNADFSKGIAGKIAKFKPHLVIGSQCD